MEKRVKAVIKASNLAQFNQAYYEYAKKQGEHLMLFKIENGEVKHTDKGLRFYRMANLQQTVLVGLSDWFVVYTVVVKKFIRPNVEFEGTASEIALMNDANDVEELEITLS